MTKKRPSKKRRRARRRLRVLIAVGSIIALLGLAALIDSALYYNKVHAGVTVSGYPMSGLTRAEATAALTRLVKEAEESRSPSRAVTRAGPSCPAMWGRGSM